MSSGFFLSNYSHFFALRRRAARPSTDAIGSATRWAPKLKAAALRHDDRSNWIDYEPRAADGIR